MGKQITFTFYFFTPSNLVFQGVPVFRGVPGCSGVFRCSGVPVFRCSGVPGCSGVPVFLVLVHAVGFPFFS